MTPPRGTKSAAHRGEQRRESPNSPQNGQVRIRPFRKNLLSRVILALVGVNVGACDSITGRDDTVVSLTLSASFVYRGTARTERLPFECRKRYDFSGPHLHTYPLYQAARMRDGSAVVFGLNGLCEYLTSRDGPDVDLDRREGSRRSSPSGLMLASLA
ncbi:hypothetical protein [Brevundimonas sp.]|uniref:hypothetical protein n=1 Tax=Brevundimonas sp. TaxID=1871086 RepID=UPI00391CB720